MPFSTDNLPNQVLTTFITHNNQSDPQKLHTCTYKCIFEPNSSVQHLRIYNSTLFYTCYCQKSKKILMKMSFKTCKKFLWTKVKCMIHFTKCYTKYSVKLLHSKNFDYQTTKYTDKKLTRLI